MQQIIRKCLVLIIIALLVSACHPSLSAPVRETPLQPANAALTNTPEVTAESTPTRIAPSPTPSSTAQLIHLTATVWEEIPQAPVLMYHRFSPQQGAISSGFKTSLTDFDDHLQALYDAGFSLVALEDWLRGEIHLPAGKRPLIITLDDLFYADQISLDQDGQPAPYSGIGRMWAFAQDHPDFGFHAALFYNFGDKSYSNQYANGEFTVQDGWRQARSDAIVWGIRNGAIPMNHFYDHPYLNQLTPDEIFWQLSENDRALREALAMSGQENLAASLPNILALPYVVWPSTDAGKQVLFDYTSPEGAPVSAIVEADYANSAKLMPAPFSPEFDPWHVPRISADWEAVNVILSQVDAIPTAEHCDLGEFTQDALSHPGEIGKMILDLTTDGACSYGYYIVGQMAFNVHQNGILQLSP